MDYDNSLHSVLDGDNHNGPSPDLKWQFWAHVVVQLCQPFVPWEWAVLVHLVWNSKIIWEIVCFQPRLLHPLSAGDDFFYTLFLCWIIVFYSAYLLFNDQRTLWIVFINVCLHWSLILYSITIYKWYAYFKACNSDDIWFLLWINVYSNNL